MAETEQLQVQPENTEEKLVYYTIAYTWLLYVIGGLYIAGPVLGWTLAGMAAVRLYLSPTPPPGKAPAHVGSIVQVWLIGMLAMLVILLIGHAENDLSAVETLKSAIGWAKGWALLGVFPFAAAVLDIRPALVYRAICRLGVQTLALLPLFLIAPAIGLPGRLYTSPLEILGGSGPAFFDVLLYTFDPVKHIARWQFFAPWSPAAGMVAVVQILCAIEERNWRWRTVGLLAGLAIALFSQSRLALVAVAVVWPLSWGVARLGRPLTWLVAAPVALMLGLFAPAVRTLIDDATAGFTGARADSSRVRAALGRIAVERWRNEAPWFGHGIVERGPHLVEYMPIGSHHSWYGLLFVKGFTGVVALAVPMAWSLLAAARLSQRDHMGQVAFSMLLVLLLYSFGENLEVLAYLYWPALILIGAASSRSAGSRDA